MPGTTRKCDGCHGEVSRGASRGSDAGALAKKEQRPVDRALVWSGLLAQVWSGELAQGRTGLSG